MREMLGAPARRKAALSAAILAGVLGAALFAVGCTTAEAPADGSETAAEEQSVVRTHEAEEWAAYLPKQVTKEDGTVVQKTPFGGTTNGYFMPEG